MALDNQHLIPDGNAVELRGAKGRVITGGGIIFLSVLSLILAITIVSLSSTGEYFSIFELLLGIGFLVLSIVAGCFGIFSRKNSCRVITYLVLCVVLAIFTGYWGFTTASLTYALGKERRLEQAYYGYAGYGMLYALLLVSTLVNVIHCLFSIAGASFTCGAVCCVPDARDTEQPMFVVPNSGAMQMQQPGWNGYNVDMGSPMSVNGNPPAYETVPSKTKA